MKTKDHPALGRKIRAMTSLALVLALASCAHNTILPGLGTLEATLAGKHHFDHIILVVLENEDAVVVERVPYMDSLAKRGALFRSYYAVAHPSYPNYLAMTAGQTFIGDRRAQADPEAYSRRDLGDAQRLINAPMVIDLLQSQHVSWDAFAEDYPIEDRTPKTCSFVNTSGLYVRKHFPFLSFQHVHDHPEWCAHIRNLKWFQPDSLAAYTFIAPNVIHDGHSAPLSSAVTWLREFLNPLLTNKKLMSSTLVVVTFDESAGTVRQTLLGISRPNVVYTVFLGDMVKAGTVSNAPYNHFNLLRTVETNFGLTPSLLDKGVASIEGVWR
jgi:acid phosphatase